MILRMHIGVRLLVSLCAGVAGFTSSGVVAAAYPKVNLAVGYQVDPNWPQRPPRASRFAAGSAPREKWRRTVSPLPRTCIGLPRKP